MGLMVGCRTCNWDQCVDNECKKDTRSVSKERIDDAISCFKGEHELNCQWIGDREVSSVTKCCICTTKGRLECATSWTRLPNVVISCNLCGWYRGIACALPPHKVHKDFRQRIVAAITKRFDAATAKQ